MNTARKEKGTLLASGFIAGGALMGVVAAVIKFKQSMSIDSEIAALGGNVTSEAVAKIKESHSFINAAWAESNAAVLVGCHYASMYCRLPCLERNEGRTGKGVN